MRPGPHQERTQGAVAHAWNYGTAEERVSSTTMALWEIAQSLAVIADAVEFGADTLQLLRNPSGYVEQSD